MSGNHVLFGELSETQLPEDLRTFIGLIERNKRYLNNDPTKYKAKIKTKYVLRRRAAFLRYIFEKYKAPSRLRDMVAHRRPPMEHWLHIENVEEIYTHISSGRSLKHTRLGRMLSKKGRHVFVEMLDSSEVETFGHAFWHAAFISTYQEYAKISLADTTYHFSRGPSRLFTMDSHALRKMLRVLRVMIERGKDRADLDVWDFVTTKIEIDPEWDPSGKTYNRLLEESEEWHAEKRIESFKKLAIGINTRETWPKMDGLSWIHSVVNSRSGKEDIWMVDEITTGIDLEKEGFHMDHCVGEYVDDCVAGRCHIVSLTKNGIRALTIEVSHDRKIQQAQGNRRKRLFSEERKIIRLWAADCNLTVDLPNGS